MLNLAPFFYKNLLDSNEIINPPEYFRVENLYLDSSYEAICSLNSSLRPSWIASSEIYTNSEGSGTSIYLNQAIYKSISEALERWAFYSAADDSNFKKFGLDINPSTTGFAAYPSFTSSTSRDIAQFEALERWAIHNFWRGKLPVIIHQIDGKLNVFEIKTSVSSKTVLVLNLNFNNKEHYAFACGKNFSSTLNHALVELNRNIRVLKSQTDHQKTFEDISDRRLYFFSTREGKELFVEKVKSAPKSLKNEPILVCDQEIKGPWTKYAKVWRYLYADSYPDNYTDHTFFMF